MNDRSRLAGHISVAALVVAYLLLLVLFVREQGAVMIASLLPTIAAAYVYGLAGGLTAGIVAFSVNGTVLFVMRADPWVAENLVPVMVGGTTNIVVGWMLGANRRLVDQLRNAQARIAEQAIVDEMTGLYNRRHAFAVLATRIEEAERHGFPLSIAYIDLDNLKLVNDTLGHGRGDEMITCFATAARESVRKSDTVFRMGGDEFLLVLPYCAEACARRVGNRLARAYAKAWKREGEASFSIGITSAGEGDTPDALVERADTLMYEDKRRGKAGLPRPSGDDAECVPASPDQAPPIR